MEQMFFNMSYQIGVTSSAAEAQLQRFCEANSNYSSQPFVMNGDVTNGQSNYGANSIQQYYRNNSNLPINIHGTFDPLTPPGLPAAVMPNVQSYYCTMSNYGQETPSPSHLATSSESEDKPAMEFTPQSTPSRNETPPESPTSNVASAAVKLENICDGGDEIGHENGDCDDVVNNNDDNANDGDADVDSNESEDDDDETVAADEKQEQDKPKLSAIQRYGLDLDLEITRNMVPFVDESIYNVCYNSHGKKKTSKCKHCKTLWDTKVSLWEHMREHLLPPKRMECDLCPFITEFRHHMQYHMNKHYNNKPFHCTECTYDCENKSMLNSHMKSHSPLYKFKCEDCGYFSKYSHMLKKHMEPLGHKSYMAFDEHGNPDPTVIIDLYGRRRGPRRKKSNTVTMSPVQKLVNRLTLRAKKCKNQRSKNKQSSSPQRSAALMGKTVRRPQQLQQNIDNDLQESNELSTTPTKAKSSNYNMHTFLRQNQKQQQQPQQPPEIEKEHEQENLSIGLTNAVPSIVHILQQNSNMFWRVQMALAAQTQHNLAQTSPDLYQIALKTNFNAAYNEEEQGNNFDSGRSISSNSNADLMSSNGDDYDQDTAMDLSPYKPSTASDEIVPINLKVTKSFFPMTQHEETPTNTAMRSARRRMLDFESFLPTHSLSPSPVLAAPPEVMDITPPTTPAHAMVPFYMGSQRTNQWHNPSSTFVNSIPSCTTTATVAKATATAVASSSGRISPMVTGISIMPNSLSNVIHECNYCGIFFRDRIVYSIHMRYHSQDDPFRCGLCGTKTNSSVQFYTHITNTAH